MAEKPLSKRELLALRHIRDRIVQGQEPPSVRELQEVLGYSSPNGAAYVLSRLAERRYIQRRKDRKLQLLREVPQEPRHERTVQVPLVGSVPCGAPLLAEQNVEALIPVSVGLASPSAKYFLLRAHGDSMNLAGIESGDLVLVRQQSTAENGDRVVALIDDEATIKEIRFGKDTTVLVPRSTSSKHNPIYVTTEFQIQGVVTATLPDWRKE